MSAPEEIDAELLAWAKAKAAEPFEWFRDYVRCAFCQWQQRILWGGKIDAVHSDTCLAMRANKVKP